jgi:uncharacterized OB-fold protein
MRCRQCGTEIADKAIVCYRCGAATTDPVRKPAEIRRRPGRVLSLAALVLLALAALFLGQASRTVLPAHDSIPAALAIGAAILLVVVRMIRRR